MDVKTYKNAVKKYYLDLEKTCTYRINKYWNRKVNYPQFRVKLHISYLSLTFGRVWDFVIHQVSGVYVHEKFEKVTVEIL